MSADLLAPRVLGGVLLVFAAALAPLFALGARDLPMNVWRMPLDRKLCTIAQHLTAWRQINTWFLVSAIVSALGLAVVAHEVRATTLGHVALVAVLAYGLGAAVWLVELVSRMTAIVIAGEETLRTGALPVWAKPVAAWGFGLFIVYAVLSNVAVLALGIALLQTTLVPGWASWTAIATSLLLVAALIVTRNNVPALNLIAPTVFGVALLL